MGSIEEEIRQRCARSDFQVLYFRAKKKLKKKYRTKGVDPNSYSQTQRKLRTDNGKLVDAKCNCYVCVVLLFRWFDFALFVCLATGKYKQWSIKNNTRIGSAGTP